ncbi:MAG: (2Fe-2S)-binding protein [Nocardioidaceae bacterium]
MIVCHCRVVSSGDIADAVDAGARTVSEVCRRTGAAQSCGTCVFSVRQVVCQHEARGASEDEEAVRAAS